jgi:dTDP-6-deoxy-L-talose 4-dehydrogenase (NAD+)
MRILITGATGFIGKALTNHFILNGHEVFALVRGDITELQKFCPGVNIICGSLSSITTNDIDSYKIERLIHLAWENVSKVILDSHCYHISIQKEFLDKVIKSKISKVVISGSCFEYGKIDGKIDVSVKPIPNTNYGRAKLELLNWLVMRWPEFRHISLSWMRIFYVFGDGQHQRSLYSQLKLAIIQNKTEFEMSRGYQIRDFIKLCDVVTDFYLESMQNGTGLTIKNTCSGNPVSVREFVENILTEHGLSMKLVLGKYPIPEYEPLAFWGGKDFILNYK